MPVAVLVGAVVAAKHVVVAVPIVADFVDTKVVTAIAVAAVMLCLFWLQCRL